MAEEKTGEVPKTTEASKQASEFKKLQENGFVVHSERYGNIAVGIKNISGLPGGIEDVVDENGRVYINFNPESDAFAIWSSKPIEDKFSSGAIDENNPNLWVSPASNTGIKPDIGLILDQMTDGQFEPTGQLKKYFDDLKAVKEIGDTIGESLTSKEPETSVPSPNLSPKLESGKMEGMTEKEPIVNKPEQEPIKPLTPEEQIQGFIDQGKIDKLLGWAKLVRIPANWNNPKLLEGIMDKGNQWVIDQMEKNPEAVDQFGYLGTAIGLRIEELKELEKKKAEPEAGQKKEEPESKQVAEAIIKQAEATLRQAEATKEQTEEFKKAKEVEERRMAAEKAREVQESEQRKREEAERERQRKEDEKKRDEEKKKKSPMPDKSQEFLEIPQDPDKDKEIELQLKVVRPILELIEETPTDCFGLDVPSGKGEYTRMLENSYSRMRLEAQREVRARIAIHDCYALMLKADGFIKQEGHYTIANAATEAERRGHAIDFRETIGVALKDGFPHLAIADAWNFLQIANRLVQENGEYKKSNYSRIIEEMNKKKGTTYRSDEFVLQDQDIQSGKVPMNYYTDSNIERKKAVEQYLAETLIAKLGNLLGDNNEERMKNARISLSIAHKLSVATLETSFFNRSAAVGNDELAEIIGFRQWRRGRAIRSRDRGPLITEGFIAGFGSSWIRTAAYFEATEREKGKFDFSKLTEQPLRVENIEISSDSAANNWGYFCKVVLGKYQALKEILLDVLPKPLTVKVNYLRKVVDLFNVATRKTNFGEMFLRTLWVAGIVDCSLVDMDLGWKADSYIDLRRELVEKELTPGSGPFLLKEGWEWVENTTSLWRRAGSLNLERRLYRWGKK